MKHLPRRSVAAPRSIGIVCLVGVVLAAFALPLISGRANAAPPPPVPQPTAMVAASQAGQNLYLPLALRPIDPPPPQPPPTAPADALYVRVNWDDVLSSPVLGDTRMVTLAFRFGYNADSGVPISDIILAFGRQVDPDDIVERQCLPAGVWGVQLVDQSDDDRTGCRGIRTATWVTTIALNYIKGYRANPANTRATSIGIGISNAIYPWACNDPRWREAGRVWRAMVDALAGQVPENGTTIFVRSAIDVESWNGEFPDDGWVACGTATLAWFDGYEERAGVRPTMNFGSDAHAELPSQWSRAQVYAVFRGRPSALAYPQIYCAGSDTAVRWAAYVDVYPAMYFYGVTSENADLRSRCGSGNSLAWDAAWQRLNTALEVAGHPRKLARSVTSFYYPSR